MRYSREKLERLLRVLTTRNDELPRRELQRIYSIPEWEIEGARKAGFVELIERKPPIGRPSIVVKILSKTPAAKLPPPRNEIEKPISQRHWLFAMFSVYSAMKGGGRYLPANIEAYRKAYPQARSRNGAYASCSRLLRNPRVFAARQWHYAVADGDAPSQLRPKTASEIWQYLKEFGSWRAKFAPTIRHRFTEPRW